MKKISLFICIVVSLFFLVNASGSEEGTAMMAENGELPETGLYMATDSNSYPENTIVDVINLENGRTVRVVVFSTLNDPSLMALLSKDAADAIGIAPGVTGRVSMDQPDDPIAVSRFSGGSATTGDPDFDSLALVTMNRLDLSELEEGDAGASEEAGTERVEGGDAIVDLPDADAEELTNAAPADSAVTEPPPAAPETDIASDIHELTLEPAETRPPEKEPDPDPSYFIDPIEVVDVAVTPEGAETEAEVVLDPSLFVEPIAAAPPAAPAPSVVSPPEPEEPEQLTPPPPQSTAFMHFINGLEKGKYYLQIAAFSKTETVQSEISKLDSNLPVVIMNAGNAAKPVYRILIGPVNLGESGALLQRFKITHKDAFVRLGT